MDRPKAIIMVTLDCVRPDHLGCYGYRGVDTPNLDWFAEKGVVFEQAICQAPNTWVSHASVFTGCNPYSHGMRTPWSTISTSCPTLAEYLSECGYATAGFPAHTLLGPAQGYARGFDLYDLDKNDFLHEVSHRDGLFARNWSRTWSKAASWVRQQPEPVFVWLHYMGTHWEPPENLSLPPVYRRKYSSFGQFHDGKISRADEICIGALRSLLREKGTLEDSLVVVFSDHGDYLPALVEGNKGHDRELHDEVMRTALIMYSPRHLPRGCRVGRQVRQVDILPSVLDIAGVQVPGNGDGISLLQHCTKPEEAPDATQYAYVENCGHHWFGVRTERWKLVLTTRPEARPPSMLDVLRKAFRAAAGEITQHEEVINSGIYRAMRDFYHGAAALRRRLGHGHSEERQDPQQQRDRSEAGLLSDGRVFALYDLENDPREEVDVSNQYPSVVSHLKQQLNNMVASADRRSEPLDEESREAIRSTLDALGYV